MSRVPIRIRLTAAFALAMFAVLAGAAVFVYQRLEADLNETIDEGLALRASAADSATAAPLDAEEGFVQIIAHDGRVLDSAGGVSGSVLEPAELEHAGREAFVVERGVEGVSGTTRVLAAPAAERHVIAVGQSLEDRDETLAGLIASFAIGGPLAVLAASMVGYGLARAGLAPIEAMSRRARRISIEAEQQMLPLGPAQDEVRRLGETLNEMLARLRASFERERSFVADASHELRTPIAVIRAELEAALASGECRRGARAAVLAAIEETDRLGQLAEDLLVIARVAEDGLPVIRERLHARDLLEGARTRFVARAAERGREIRVEAEPGLELEADPLRMRQALGNLVDNALRHGAGEITLAARRAGDAVELEVRDQGSGFDPEIAARAFERFTRGDPSRSGGGAGLGLALVRAIANAHGGTVEIVPGAGATVRLRVPDGSVDASQGDLSSST